MIRDNKTGLSKDKADSNNSNYNRDIKGLRRDDTGTSQISMGGKIEGTRQTSVERRNKGRCTQDT
jgi:hypothetical protein